MTRSPDALVVRMSISAVNETAVHRGGGAAFAAPPVGTRGLLPPDRPPQVLLPQAAAATFRRAILQSRGRASTEER